MQRYNFEDIRKNNLLLYEYIRGSHAYGLEKPDGTSDIDTGGIFMAPYEQLLGLGLDYQDQISSERNDDTWLELTKYFQLLLKSNPTVLESLFIPEKCILYEHPIMTQIKMHRDKFITKECFKPIIGYSYEEIKKCRGLNKRFLQEKIERKGILDFVYTNYKQGSSKIQNWLEYRNLKQKYCGLANVPNMHDNYAVFYDWGNHFLNEKVTFEDLKEAYKDDNVYDTINIVKRIKNGEKSPDLVDKLHKAQFKNMVNFIMEKYDLRSTSAYFPKMKTLRKLNEWFYSQKPIGYKGMTNEEETSNELRLSSVEKGRSPICYISYNKDGYSTHSVDYKNQKDWEANRNHQRYIENRGKMFDRKNVAHSVRLLHMGLEIAKTGKFNVDRTNIDRDFILNIRLGNTSYEEIIEYIEAKKDEMEKAMAESTIPDSIDVEFVNGLLLEIRKKQIGLLPNFNPD